MKFIKPNKDCPVCHGLGIIYCADSWDRDNGTTCSICLNMAKKKRAKLVLPYTR